MSSSASGSFDGVVELKCSEPKDFVEEMMRLSEIADIKIWGGCCGTDHRHMKQVAEKLNVKHK